MERQILYNGYRHFKEEKVIEKVMFVFDDEEDNFSTLNESNNIQIKTLSGDYYSSSYSDGNIAVVVSQFFNFIYLFFTNLDISEDDSIIGVWAEYSPNSENGCQSGRILLTKARENRLIEPCYFDYSQSDNLLENFIPDISTLYLIRKFFFNETKSEYSLDTQSDKIFKLITMVSQNLEQGIQEIRDINNNLSKELSDLKMAIFESGKVDLSEMFDLKIQVAEGNLAEAFGKIKQYIIQIEDKDLLNEFIMCCSSNSRIEDHYNRGLVQHNDFNVEKNRINLNLLSIIDKLSKSQKNTG